mmetsp:Transcript_11903/g.22022  ORF Transcript_11903/g.22022 Transcript_11903/m.22022 type:complete len:325 (-) Transcript_11903:1830-2804(-)
MHPNIVKMRAVSDTPRLSLDTFLIMDRLYGTLDEKLETWIQTSNILKGCCGMTKDSAAEQELLKERVLVLYDLTVAFSYMHDLSLLYRDIKPENIGFDIRGDVKIFDFGLMKCLDDHLKPSKNVYGYKLTAFTGSIPYMAPEIALKEPYSVEADVFSLSMLMWEILSLEILYPDYSIKDYFFRVCKMNERPSILGKWPAVLKALVQEGWDRYPQKRPTMKRMATLLRGLLQDLSSDDAIVNRTQHMMDKSKRSFHNNIGDPMSASAGTRRRRSGKRGDSQGGGGSVGDPSLKMSATSSGGASSCRRVRESLHQYESPDVENGNK